MKICFLCKVPKIPIEFSIDRQARDGLRSCCRACDNQSKRMKRAADPEKARAIDRANYAANPEPKRRSARKRYAEIPGKMRAYLRERDLKNSYGITTAQFDSMVNEQGGACDICRKSFTKTGHVDHCHKTGKVRGILCQDCNLGLGRFKDSSAVAQLAVNYLKKHGK